MGMFAISLDKKGRTTQLVRPVGYEERTAFAFAGPKLKAISEGGVFGNV